MPKISIQELMGNGDLQGWTNDVGDRLTRAMDSLRNNTDDVLQRLSNGLPQPGNIGKHRDDRTTYGAWTLEDSRGKLSD
jgi:hypothetical protein